MSLSEQIYTLISQNLAREESGSVLRASAANNPSCKRWFQNSGFPAEVMTPRAILNFTLGDLTEHTLAYFVKQCVGPGKVYSEVDFGESIGTMTIQNKAIESYAQQTVTIEFNGLKITGHADGWGKRQSDGKWELIEFKSCSSYSYGEFERTGPGDYLNQAHALLMSDKAKSLDCKEVRFVFLKKETGHIFDVLCPFDESIAAQVRTAFLESVQEAFPGRKVLPDEQTFRGKPTGKSKLNWKCSYCPYMKTCWGDSITTEFEKGKPVHYFDSTKPLPEIKKDSI